MRYLASLFKRNEKADLNTYFIVGTEAGSMPEARISIEKWLHKIYQNDYQIVFVTKESEVPIV